MKLSLNFDAITVAELADKVRTMAITIQNAWLKEHDSGSRHYLPWSDVPYTAGYFSASTGTWTVEIADQVTFCTRKPSRETLDVIFVINGTTVSSTPASLSIHLPDGHVAARTIVGNCRVVDNGTERGGLVVVSRGGTTIDIFPINTNSGAVVSFSAATNATSVQGQITIPIQG